ncbi:hypothetical protein [Burkholderia sp. LMG 13014]|uniref:hypothetical protein n=1 Tax=Burkholderia sp. LMG 13014 TaxID=2709306 RepID=UPI0019624491|nr:hypothetical protein [Burkholderia sp. LMG 13014]
MFSKKKPEGTEDQAYDLMNLGGFGGLKRKSSPGTNETKPAHTPQKPSVSQQVLEALIAWAKENAANNEMLLKTIHFVEQHKNDKDVLHIAKIIFDSFDSILEQKEDYDTDEFLADRDKVKIFISTKNRQEELAILTVSIANIYAANLIERLVGNNRSEGGKLFITIMKDLAKEYAEVISR